VVAEYLAERRSPPGRPSAGARRGRSPGLRKRLEARYAKDISKPFFARAMHDPTDPTGDSYYPQLHRHWGVCAEELLHHTSRYYCYTEAFLRNLSGRRSFEMAGYRPKLLSEEQRKLMGAILTGLPDRASGSAIVRVVEAARRGDGQVDPDLTEQYRKQLALVPHNATVAFDHDFQERDLPEDLPPLDPFLAIAERLQMPVAVHGRCVEVSLRLLAQHLDSPQHQVRENLQDSVLWLHEAGYRLRNHPDLTHAEAEEIGDNGCV